MAELWTQERLDTELAKAKSGRVTRVGNQIRTVQIWKAVQGPLLADGNFYSPVYSHCSKCGHRLH